MKKKDLSAAAAEATQRLFSAAGENEGAPIRKQLNGTEQKILELYNAGTVVQKDIADKIGKDKGTVSRALKRIREEYPEKLQTFTRAEEEYIERKVEAYQEELEEKAEEYVEAKTEEFLESDNAGSEKEAREYFRNEADKEIIKALNDGREELEKYVISERDGTEKQEKKEVAKRVFSFRADVESIKVWKSYAAATEQTMESFGSAAMAEYMQNHKLNDKQKTKFDAYML